MCKDRYALQSIRISVKGRHEIGITRFIDSIYYEKIAFGIILVVTSRATKCDSNATLGFPLTIHDTTATKNPKHQVSHLMNLLFVRKSDTAE